MLKLAFLICLGVGLFRTSRYFITGAVVFQLSFALGGGDFALSKIPQGTVNYYLLTGCKVLKVTKIFKLFNW